MRRGWVSALLIGFSQLAVTSRTKLDVINRDVCIIGGGSSGTYTAVRLTDLGQSVVVVEKEDVLGGHTNTFVDPINNATVDYGEI